MKNYDTTNHSNGAATYRTQLMLNRCGDNTVSLPGIAETFYNVIINLHIAVIPTYSLSVQLLRWPFP